MQCSIPPNALIHCFDLMDDVPINLIVLLQENSDVMDLLAELIAPQSLHCLEIVAVNAQLVVRGRRWPIRNTAGQVTSWITII